MPMSKVFYTALCLKRKHGLKGHKSGASHFFVGVPSPKTRKASKHTGCPQCRAEGENAE